MASNKPYRLKSAIQIILGGHVVTAGLATYWGNETWYRNFLMPVMRLLSAENAHWLAVKAAKYKLVPNMNLKDAPSLKTEVWGKQFSNPIGLAAGFDKDGQAVDGLLKMGFGFVEVGTVTPQPQPGNPKPRLFRLLKDKAVINRYGFNSQGFEVMQQNLQLRTMCLLGPEVPDDRNMLNEQLWSPDRPKFRGHTHPEPGIVGVNLGKNKTTDNEVEDYTSGVRQFGTMADYLVINISSPNTPGLRNLQGRQRLQQLVDKVIEERDKLPESSKVPVLVKIAPDLTEQDKLEIAAVLARRPGGVEGLVVCNTTLARPGNLQGKNADEAGGLSGQPLKHLATKTIGDMYRLTQGRIPIVGVGGVSSGQDAYEKIRAGASLIQIYTALTYDGPPLVPRVKRELAEILEREGFSSVSEAVGADCKPS